MPTALQKAYHQHLVLLLMWSHTQSERTGPSLPAREDGKDKGNGNHVTLFECSGWAVLFRQELVISLLLLLSCIISFIKGEGAGLGIRGYFRNLLSKLYPSNSCGVVTSPANFWIASPHCIGLDAGPGFGGPSGDQWRSPAELFPTSLGIKPVLPGSAWSSSLVLEIPGLE